MTEPWPGHHALLNHLLIIIILCMYSAQQAPSLHVLRLPLYLRLQRQHRLAQEATLEQRLALCKAVPVLQVHILLSLFC